MARRSGIFKRAFCVPLLERDFASIMVSRRYTLPAVVAKQNSFG